MTELDGKPKTANERLLSSTIRRTALVQRYGVGQVRNVVGFLNESVFPDLIERLRVRLERIKSRGFDSGVWTTNRYRDMVAEVHDILTGGIGDAKATIKAELRDFAKVEADWQIKTVQAQVPTVEIGGGVDLRTAATVVSQPIQGQPLDKWFAGLARDTQARLTKQLGIGMTSGETGDQIIRRVRPVLDVTRAQAAAVVKTAVNHVSTQVRQQTFNEIPDIIKGVQWVATLDSKTSDICKALDGKVFPVDSGQRPPAHVNCRSTIVPVLKSWKELGINLTEAPEGTRATVNGQVASSLTYGEWLADQPRDVQDEALGVGKARLFRAGEITVQDLVTQQGRPLTLAELQR